MPTQRPQTMKLFCSYSHKDERLRDKLDKHLRSLERENIITTWYDRRITPGIEWAGQIDEHLNTADIILLLVSADFISSNYCYDVELTRAMQRHENGEARVLPIILRPCDWKLAPFAKLQALPTDAKPITMWQNQDVACLSVVDGIRQVVKELASNQNTFPRSERHNAENLVAQPLAMTAHVIKCAYCQGKGKQPSMAQSVPSQDLKASQQPYCITSWHNWSCPVCQGKGMLRIECDDIVIPCMPCEGIGSNLSWCSDLGVSDGAVGRYDVMSPCTHCQGLGVQSLTGELRILR